MLDTTTIDTLTFEFERIKKTGSFVMSVVLSFGEFYTSVEVTDHSNGTVLLKSRIFISVDIPLKQLAISVESLADYAMLHYNDSKTVINHT